MKCSYVTTGVREGHVKSKWLSLRWHHNKLANQSKGTKTRHLVVQIELDILMCIYTFDCSCGASYVGRTTRQLSKRIREHIPTWFGKGQQKSINSSILAHLVDTNHQVDTQKAFKVIYRIPSKLPRGLRVRLLHTAEAVCIRLLKPDLCIQKKYVQALALPWPEKT